MKNSVKVVKQLAMGKKTFFELSNGTILYFKFTFKSKGFISCV